MVQIQPTRKELERKFARWRTYVERNTIRLLDTFGRLQYSPRANTPFCRPTALPNPCFGDSTMSTPTNKSRLINAGILDAQKSLTQEQDEAIDSLTTGEVDALISAAEKLADFDPGEGIGIPRFS